MWCLAFRRGGYSFFSSSKVNQRSFSRLQPLYTHSAPPYIRSETRNPPPLWSRSIPLLWGDISKRFFGNEDTDERKQREEYRLRGGLAKARLPIEVANKLVAEDVTLDDLKAGIFSQSDLENFGIKKVVHQRRLLAMKSDYPEFEWKWQEPRPFVQTTGSSWEYQAPKNALDTLKRALPDHYQLWKDRKTDKNHPLFLVFSGPGTGKSRLLDELPELARESAKSLPELYDLLDNAFVFKISFENGMRYLSNEGTRGDEILGTRMMWQMSPMDTLSSFLNRKKKYTIEDALNAIPRDHTKPSAVFFLVDGLQMVPHTSGSSETVFAEIIKSVCNKINDSGRDFFVVGAVAATVSNPVEEILHHSRQVRDFLYPEPLDGHAIVKSSNALIKMLVNDTGGHGRALEMLEESIEELGGDFDNLRLDMLAPRLHHKLAIRYGSWFRLIQKDLLPLFEAVFARRRLSLEDKISPNFTVENALGLGLIHLDPVTEILEVPYILFWLLATSGKQKHAAFARLTSDRVSGPLERRTGLEAWGSWQDFVANFQSLKSKVFDGKEITLAEYHAGAKLSVFATTSLIRVQKQDVVWTKKRYPSRSDKREVIEIIEHEQGQVPFNKLCNVLVVNGLGAPAADVFSRVYLQDSSFNAAREQREGGVWINESFACRHRQKEILSQSDYENERDKAAGPDDFFMMFVTGDSDVNLESNGNRNRKNGLVDCKNFSAYFGPFAGRAFCLREEPPNINTAPRSVLEAVEGIGPARAKIILQERVSHPFKNLQDASCRTQIPEHVLNRLTF